MNTSTIEPGTILFDRTGAVSEAVPATYIVLSRDYNEQDCRNEWRVACFRACCDGWMGAPVVIMWDESIARLEIVGKLQSDHLGKTT